MVVHSEDGLDEISIAAPTHVAELKDGVVKTYTITPEDFSMQRQALDSLIVDSASESPEKIQQVLANQAGPERDIICLNSGAAIYVAGLADSHQAGVAKAQQLIAEGAAAAVFERLIAFTNKAAAE